MCVYVCNHYISSYESMKTSDQRRNLKQEMHPKEDGAP